METMTKKNETSRSSEFGNSIIQPVLVGLACVAGLGAVLRVLGITIQDRLDEVTLKYLAVAGVLLLLRDVKSLALGDFKVELNRKIDELETRVEDTQAAAIGTKPAVEFQATESERKVIGFQPKPGAMHDDPWKGVFGGLSTVGTRELVSEVSPIGSPGLFRVRLQVRSTNPRRDPLRGSVQFFLHPTFGNDRPVVTVGSNGVAELSLTAWGAFTVGAVADDGRTKLELDLAEQTTAPAEFRAN